MKKLFALFKLIVVWIQNKVYTVLFLGTMVILICVAEIFIFVTLVGVIYVVRDVVIFLYYLNISELITYIRQLITYQFGQWIELFLSIGLKWKWKMTALFVNNIVYVLGPFFQMVLDSKTFCYGLLGIMASIGAIATIFLVRRISFVFQKLKNNPKTELTMLEFLIFVCTGFATIIPFISMVKKIVSYSRHFVWKIFQQMVQNRIGAGLLCGFISTATMAYMPYLLLAPRLSLDNFEDSFFFEHHQKRVGAITSFLLGQTLKFLFFYKLTVYEALFKWNLILLLFLGFFLFQVWWTRETIVKNYRYLYPNDKRKKIVKRVLFVQLEFMANFFLQLLSSDSQIEKLDSTVRNISLRYIEDKVFLRMTFVGWFLGHVVFTLVYMRVFDLLRVWVNPYFKDLFHSKGGGGPNKDNWDFFVDPDKGKDKK